MRPSKLLNSSLPHNFPHGLHLLLGLLPFLLHLALGEESATGIEVELATLVDVHAAKGYIEMGLAIRHQRTDKATVVLAVDTLVVEDKLACLFLRNAADGWGREQLIEHIA